MAGSNDDGRRRPLTDMGSRFQGQTRVSARKPEQADIVPTENADTELFDALKTLGEDILDEPTPKRLIDALRTKKP